MVRWGTVIGVKGIFTRTALYGLVGLAATAAVRIQARAESTPVLTVCEALRDLKVYNDRDVVIVGRSAPTFEGTFLSEDCEPDGRTLIQGNRWLSAIWVSYEDQRPGRQTVFQFDEDVLYRKLIEVKRTTRLRSKQKSKTGIIDFSDHWWAVFGRLVSPVTLLPHRPPTSSQTRNTPGNGFGANGSDSEHGTSQARFAQCQVTDSTRVA